MRLAVLVVIALASVAHRASGESITRIWLTHGTSSPDTITVNWETPTPAPSRVAFGTDATLGTVVDTDTMTTLHHVVIPFPESGALHYRVESGIAQSDIHRVKSYGGDALRIAFAADWQDTPPLGALVADDPHLLVSCGDFVHGLMRFDKPGDRNYTEPFGRVIEGYADLFTSTPFMPLLGNHDRQLFPRLLKPPASPIYDVEATAFRAFFPLPAPGWRWHFDVPGFGLRLVALDMSHTKDFGTTWQSCHAFGSDSEQFLWYRNLMNASDQPFVLTMYNEWHHLVNRHADGGWMPLIQRGSAAISGFGLFAERAEYDELPCFNTALQTGEVFGNGARTKFHRKVPSYLLITLFREQPMRVELKDLQGSVMDATEWPPRKR